MDPTMYASIKLSPFVAPSDPGNVSIYPNFAAPQLLKTIDKLWENAKKFISHTSTSARHASACSMKTFLISSRCPTTLC
jgi:hypothetical protein